MPGLKRGWKKWANDALPNWECNQDLNDGSAGMSALHLALLAIYLVSNDGSLRVTEWPDLTQVPVMEQFLPPSGKVPATTGVFPLSTVQRQEFHTHHSCLIRQP